ncbi:MAG TPA: tetratricopeptide repeat protein, partial [Pirellulales bacterium]
LARGRTLFEQGKLEEAVAALNEAIESSPKPAAEALLLRGTAYLEQSKYDAAVADFSRALKIDPSDTRALSRRATALLRQGKDQAAIDDFTRAIEDEPDPRDYVGRAMAYWNSGRNADAIADLSQSLSLAPDSSDAHFKRGLVYLDQQQWQPAKQDFAAALKGDPENADLLATYARLLATAPDAEVRQGTLAVALATQACQLASDSNSDCFDTLGAAYAEAGQFDEAIRAAQTAIGRERDPATKQEYTARLVLYHAKRPYHLEP